MHPYYRVFASTLMLCALPSAAKATTLTFDIAAFAGVTLTPSEQRSTVVELDLSWLDSIRSVRLEWSAYLTPGLAISAPNDPLYATCRMIGCPSIAEVGDRQILSQPVFLGARLFDADSELSYRLTSDFLDEGYVQRGKSHSGWRGMSYLDAFDAHTAELQKLLPLESLNIELSLGPEFGFGSSFTTLVEPSAAVFSAQLVVEGFGLLDKAQIEICNDLPPQSVPEPSGASLLALNVAIAAAARCSRR